MRKLTERERLMFKYLAEGKRHQDIADILGMHKATVRRSLSRATEKVGAETTHQVVAMIIKSENDPSKPPDGVD